MRDAMTPLEIMYRGMADALGTCGPEEFLSHAEAALAALEVAGYAVAPVEPTADMADAGARAAGGALSGREAARIYIAMLGAAPK